MTREEYRAWREEAALAFRNDNDRAPYARCSACGKCEYAGGYCSACTTAEYDLVAHFHLKAGACSAIRPERHPELMVGTFHHSAAQEGGKRVRRHSWQR